MPLFGSGVVRRFLSRPLVQRGLSLLQQTGSAVASPGRYVPAAESPTGEEIVEPKGVMWSKTIWAGLIGAVISGNALYVAFTSTPIDWSAVDTNGGLLITSIGAIVGRVVAWFPTRGPSIGEPPADG